MNPDSAVTLVVAGWGVSEALLAIAKRRRGAAASHDRGSLVLLFAAFTAASTIAFILRARHVAPMHASLAVALVLFVAGLALRWWSILTLGRHFTMDVVIAEEHRLITSGPYRVLRHPSYAGLLLLVIAAGLAMRDWVSFGVMVLVPLLPLAYRIAIEERALASEFGAQWDAHRARTWRLIPWVY